MKELTKVKEMRVEWFKVNLMGSRMMEIMKKRKLKMNNRIENSKHFANIL
jgi:hypothetical protein